MPEKKMFNITFDSGEKIVSVSVCQIKYPNGYMLFKLTQQKTTYWVINFNDKWLIAGTPKAEYFTLRAIVKLHQHTKSPGYMHLV